MFVRSSIGIFTDTNTSSSNNIHYNILFLTLVFRCSSDDQVNTGALLDQLSKNDFQHQFRPLTDSGSDDFLLVLQTRDQKRLMEMYGQEICLLDATYKTSRYSLPLFFVVVPTNTSYQVIASFLISKETTASISEALGVLLKWNPSWSPKFWMTDFDAAEMGAIEHIFPGKFTGILLTIIYTHKERKTVAQLKRVYFFYSKLLAQITCFVDILLANIVTRNPHVT